MKKFFSLFFVMLLTAPIVLWLAGHLRGNGDNTVRQGFPVPHAVLLQERGYYQAVEDWFDLSLPAAKPLKIFHNWLNYHLFSATTNTSVHIGIHDWLYPEGAVAGHLAPTVARRTGQRLFLELHAVEKMIMATGRRLLITVVPGKATLYPEYLGSGFAASKASVYQALVAANDRHPLTGFIGLNPALIKAKLGGTDVYDKRSRRWTCGGAAAAAEQILDVHELGTPQSGQGSGIPCPPPDNDLYRLLLGEEPQERPPLAGHSSGPHAVNGPTAVFYGDDYLNRLLPFISRAFNGMAVIDSTQEPTFGQNVMGRESDMVVLVCGEDGLEGLHLNLESVYATTAGQMSGVGARPIPLDGAMPVAQCALDITPDGLQIRSSGEAAFFALPRVQGSTASVFRMEKLTFSPAHQGRITVRIRPDLTGPIQRTLNRETRNLLIPLPFDESVEIQINPGPHPGVFILEKAELLSFYGQVPPLASAGDIYSGMEIQPIASPAAPPTLAPGPQAANHPTDELPDIGLTDIAQGRVFQRQGEDADIVVTGTYTGTPGPVEARVVAAETDAVAVPWTVVDGSPENGLYTGILRHVPQGGWYRLQVRSGIAPWVVIEGGNRWGVGMLIACIGQSNMREWFYSGKDHQPSPFVRLYRDGEWVSPGTEGNGALALGNRLAKTLTIPVGLLDYAVNGTGLTAKAEWGKGFWLDTGPDSIYRQAVDGINSTGGAVEYVLWMQGEADAARGTVTREEYRTALERFVNDQIRSDIKNGSQRPQLPFLIIPLVKRPTGRDTSCQWIRDAQMDTLTSIDECYLAALSIDLENRGRQHLAPASYSTLGVRTAQTILYLLGKVSYHRGPAVRSVTRVSGRVFDIAILHRGGNDFTPWPDITGFDVMSAGQPLPIDTVSRLDENTIRIRLKDQAQGEVSVRYLYGAHPDTSKPVRDNTNLRLPLEPFTQ